MKCYEMVKLSISFFFFLNHSNVCYNMDDDMDMIQATLGPSNTHYVS